MITTEKSPSECSVADISCGELPIKIIVRDAAVLPVYQTLGASGADLVACIEQSRTIDPGCVAVVETGIYIEVPEGYEAQIRSRSGLAAQHQVCVLNAPGTIDCDYRGEIKVILMNHGNNPFVVNPKMRIAQMVFAPVIRAFFVPSSCLGSTERGPGGLGHTGL